MLSLKAGMSSIYPTTLFRSAQIGRNVKFSIALINKNGHPELIQVTIGGIKALSGYLYQ
jgi:hypothetical protein